MNYTPREQKALEETIVELMKTGDTEKLSMARLLATDCPKKLYDWIHDELDAGTDEGLIIYNLMHTTSALCVETLARKVDFNQESKEVSRELSEHIGENFGGLMFHFIEVWSKKND